ncbi:MAG: pseudouridine synthase [Lachnospiraceae bacterium]|nr:pseudouridine synthase [Lachnospiraceae bacterium]MBQ4067725.1 pseudouridine synthase [Lachnospiraceae bacterium]
MAKRSKNIIEEFNQDEPVRLNKFLSDAGICSRREADRLIEAGKVTVDGKVAVMGQKVLPTQKIICNGKSASRENELILIALNKPVGIECTCDRKNPDNIIDFLNYPKRVYTIGRLDKNSEGLILLTNDGSIVNKISKSVNYHEKEYIVSVNKKINADFIEKMSSGVPILDTVTRPCTVEKIDDKTFKIILTQGLNRQIRRMCETLGYKVMTLKRIRIMNINLGKLKLGTYRNVTDSELDTLLKKLK